MRRVLETRAARLGPQSGTGAAPDMTAVARLLDRTANDVLRDRAPLLCGFAGAFRRGELTRLVWSDVRFVDEGLVLRLRRSKTDLAGVGRDVGIPWLRSLRIGFIRTAARDGVADHLVLSHTGLRWLHSVELHRNRERLVTHSLAGRVGL